MKLAANLSSLWRELPYLDRFEAAAAAGFKAVVVPMPYDMSAKDTQRAALAAGLPILQISAPPPNYTGGARGFAAVPGAEARFAYDIRRAQRYCEALRVSMIHIMAGPASGAGARATLVSNLEHAVASLPKNITLTLQPQAQEGAYLQDYGLAADIIAEVGSPRLGLQFHSHHAEMLHGCAARAFSEFAEIIHNVQIADVPMGPPGTGTVEFDALLSAMSEGDYQGWCVADYASGALTSDTLGWIETFGR